jgi:hypothetical protein
MPAAKLPAALLPSQPVATRYHLFVLCRSVRSKLRQHQNWSRITRPLQRTLDLILATEERACRGQPEWWEGVGMAPARAVERVGKTLPERRRVRRWCRAEEWEQLDRLLLRHKEADPTP